MEEGGAGGEKNGLEEEDCAMDQACGSRAGRGEAEGDCCGKVESNEDDPLIDYSRDDSNSLRDCTLTEETKGHFSRDGPESDGVEKWEHTLYEGNGMSNGEKSACDRDVCLNSKSEGGNAMTDNEKNEIKTKEENDTRTDHGDNAKRFKHEDGCSSSNSRIDAGGDVADRDTACSSDTASRLSSSNNATEGSNTRDGSGLNRYFNDEDESSNNESDDHSSNNTLRRRLFMDTSSDNSTYSFLHSPPTHSSTVINDTDTETEEEHPVLKKEKPKHKWFIVPEVLNRQMGYNSNCQSSELFQRRCYGSLHCVQRLELMYKLEQHDGCVNSLHYNADGSLLASGSDDLKVVIWDWKNGKALLNFETKHKSNVFQSKFLPLAGDLHIATCSRDGQVRLAQVSALEGLRSSRKLGSHRGPCHKLAVHVDQPHVVLSAGEDSLVLNHDLRSSKSERIVQVKSDDQEVPLYSIHSHPLNSHEFCLGGRDAQVRVYDQRKCGSSVSAPLHTYHPFKKSRSMYSFHVTCAVYNYNGSEILASYNDEDIYLFDVNSQPGSYVQKYQGHRNGATIKGVNFFGPKSEYVISGSDCGNIFFWDKSTEAIVQWLLADDNGVVNCLEPHPRFPFLCTSGLDWDVKVWVPSYEHDPTMTGLSDTVKTNLKARSQLPHSGDLDDTQMLWMLWRQLSGTESLRRAFHFAMNGAYRGRSRSGNNSSSSDNSSNSMIDSDSEESDSPPGCTAS